MKNIVFMSLFSLSVIQVHAGGPPKSTDLLLPSQSVELSECDSQKEYFGSSCKRGDHYGDEVPKYTETLELVRTSATPSIVQLCFYYFTGVRVMCEEYSNFPPYDCIRQEQRPTYRMEWGIFDFSNAQPLPEGQTQKFGIRLKLSNESVNDALQVAGVKSVSTGRFQVKIY